MFRLSFDTVGVQAYGRTSEGRASQKGASGHQRASAKSVVVEAAVQLVVVLTRHRPWQGKTMNVRCVFVLACLLSLAVLMSSCATPTAEKAGGPAVTIADIAAGIEKRIAEQSKANGGY